MTLIKLALSVASLLAPWNFPGAELTSRVLTPDAADKYSITRTGGTIDITAPGLNTGSNLRAVFWPKGAPNLINSRVCSTWTTRSVESVQEGHAHNIAVLPDRVHAITLTKNVVFDIHWVFNVHVWDSSQNPAFTQVAQFNMMDVMFRPNGSYHPLPWRVCTELRGYTLRFKIWFPNTMKEPAWSDTRYVRSTTVPDAWAERRGKAGLYVGHIPPGGWASYTQADVWPLP